jgi:hypothetical protein
MGWRWLMRDGHDAEDVCGGVAAGLNFSDVAGNGRAWFLRIRNTCYGWRTATRRQPISSMKSNAAAPARPINVIASDR